MSTETLPLSEQEIEYYRENGFVQVNDALTEAEIDELADLTDEMNAEIEKSLPPMEERAAYQQVFLQIVNVWRRDERFKKFTFHKGLADMARRLIGAEHVRLWHDHLMTKMPGKDGKPTDWHQDFPYWSIKQPGAMSIWIPMQDVDWENGCMHFVKGSHDWGINEVIHLDAKEKEDIFDICKDRIPEKIERVYVPLRRGSVTFHNGLTFHMAGKNYSDKPRRVLSIIYMADGSIFNGNKHGISEEAGYTDADAGKAFQGEFFPVIL